jgi:hypothetical protein
LLHEQASQLAYHYTELTVALQKEPVPQPGDPYTVTAQSSDGMVLKSVFSNPLERSELSLGVSSILSAGSPLQRSVPDESLDPVRDIGSRLFDALFQGPLSRVFSRDLDAPGDGVRLCLIADDEDAAALPWEFLYDRRRDDFLVLSTRSPLVRRVGVLEAPVVVPPLEPPIRVLLAISDVTGSWNVDPEVGALRSALEGSGVAEVTIQESVTAESFAKALSDTKPHLVHLTATGVEEGDRGVGPFRQRFAFLADDSTDTPTSAAVRPHVLLDADRLAAFFTGHDELRCVVLNGCHTDLLAPAVARIVPMTIGMRGLITDVAAAAFTDGLHQALAGGLPIEAAVTGGRLAIESRDPGGREWSAPVLYLQTTDGTLLAPTGRGRPTAKTTLTNAIVATPRDAAVTDADRELQSLNSLLAIHQSNLDQLNAQRDRLGSGPPGYVLEQIDTATAEVVRLRERIAALQASDGGSG